jgi:hypothetical protein
LRRLLIVGLVYYLSWKGYGICEKFFPESVDDWDLLRHSLFMGCCALLGLLVFVPMDDRYEPIVRLGVAVYIFGVLANDITDNFLGNRDFSWYDPFFVIIGYFTGGRSADPDLHEKVFSKVLTKKGYHRTIKFLSWSKN